MSAARHDPAIPVQAADIDRWHDETDVIVVGCGGAGACAALEAHAAGAGVTVLELASAPGGTTALAGGQVGSTGQSQDSTSVRQPVTGSDPTRRFSMRLEEGV